VETGFDPTLHLFDNVPGGIGLAARIHEEAADLLARARLLLRRCACLDGCPLCVGVSGGLDAPPPGAPVVAAMPVSRKRAAELLFERLLIDG
jgi:DEAD/DEAH box helicase domain-containing protein